ncbi:hypothetical protein CAC42_3024 [Sphaceloma murrayae]|uniref:Uncharacterized protein n=1 Tax=Sphaceloma murrayae TaxID=2082308 RepID=A0A2K1QRM7_9PEZI|nr:hypothetical protein CAC42_3024 [Sphaceloma murrayae]
MIKDLLQTTVSFTLLDILITVTIFVLLSYTSRLRSATANISRLQDYLNLTTWTADTLQTHAEASDLIDHIATHTAIQQAQLLNHQTRIRLDWLQTLPFTLRLPTWLLNRSTLYHQVHTATMLLEPHRNSLLPLPHSISDSLATILSLLQAVHNQLPVDTDILHTEMLRIREGVEYIHDWVLVGVQKSASPPPTSSVARNYGTNGESGDGEGEERGDEGFTMSRTASRSGGEEADQVS